MEKCVLIIFFINVVIKSIETQFISTNPSDQYTSLSKSVKFECIITNYSSQTDLIEWCKNNFCTWGRPFEVSNGRLQFKSLPKYFIIGNRDKGEWNLYIENVTVSDEGEYKCTVTRRFEHSNKLVKFESKAATLRLIRTPQSINIQNSSNLTISLIANEIKTIRCLVIDGIPEPNIYWRINNELFLTNYSEIIKKYIYDNKTNSNIYHYISELEISPLVDWQDKFVECFIDHLALNKKLSTKKKINLNYAPILDLRHEPNDENLIEGKKYKFSCFADSKPDTQKLKISLNKLESSNELTITATRDLNGNEIICEGENIVSKKSLNKTLNILYSPKFVETPQEIIITNRTQVLTLNCNVDSNPESNVIWFKNYKELIEIGNKLKLVTIHTGSSEYTCKAFNQYQDPIFFTTSIVVEGTPTFIGDKLYKIDIDNYLNVSFKVLSSPPIKENPICKKYIGIKTLTDLNNNNNYELKITNKFIHKTYDNMNVVRNYDLTINSIVENDFGVYNCIVYNIFGSSEFIFEIKPKFEEKSFLILTVAAVLSIVFIAINLFIIIICRYRMKQLKTYTEKYLPNVADDNNSNQNSLSPNLSISELVSVEAIHDDQISDKSYSSKKKLLQDISINNYTPFNTSIAIIFPTDTNYFSLIKNDIHTKKLPQYDTYYFNGSNREISQNNKSSNLQIASNLYSKFQTNV